MRHLQFEIILKIDILHLFCSFNLKLPLTTQLPFVPWFSLYLFEYFITRRLVQVFSIFADPHKARQYHLHNWRWEQVHHSTIFLICPYSFLLLVFERHFQSCSGLIVDPIHNILALHSLIQTACNWINFLFSTYHPRLSDFCRVREFQYLKLMYELVLNLSML